MFKVQRASSSLKVLAATTPTIESSIGGGRQISRHFDRTHSSSSSSSDGSSRTALYDFHVKSKGKIVDFGGFLLPVQYADLGIAASHRHTRAHASIFDVSHMLQTYMRGKDAIACIESICPADIRATPDGSGTLSVFTNEAAGILDDLIITRVSEKLLYIVSNAAMRAQDMDIMSAAVSKFKADGKDVSVEFLTPKQQSLIAVQGPKAVAILEKVLPPGVNLRNLFFMQSTICEVAGVSGCRVTRCGYTGEDGVEISVDSERVEHVTEALLSADENMKLAGLGARDSLRIEAGLCLYGSDISPQTTPVEAGLTWLIAKRRRAELNFPGAELIARQLTPSTDRSTHRRLGVTMVNVNNPPPARAGAKVFHNNRPVGSITSGCPSPSLGKNIAMGYIEKDLKKPGTHLQLQIRDKLFDAEVQRMPFVKTNYYTKPKKP